MPFLHLDEIDKEFVTPKYSTAFGELPPSAVWPRVEDLDLGPRKTRPKARKK